MPAIWPLGNDLVDVRSGENEISAAKPAVLARVLAPQELTAVAGDARVFWAYWAAKEAAYKALRKCDPGLIFAHRRFVVDPEVGATLDRERGNAYGVITHADRQLALSWTWCDDWVHCLAGGEPDNVFFRVSTISDCRQSKDFAGLKRSAALTAASTAARVLALTLLEQREIVDVEVVRAKTQGRPGPPQVMRDGEVLSGIDISLSHDGRYAAAAVSCTKKGRGLRGLP